MAQVKFYRGLSTAYLPSSTHKDCIFFATDTQQLMLNNVAYGVNPSDAAIISNAITSVTWVSPDTLQFKRGDGSKEYLNVTFPTATQSAQGLMAKTDKVKLDGIEAGAQVNVIENVVIDGNQGTIADKVLTMNPGFAKAADVYTKTDAESMVDGKIATALTSVYEYKGSVATFEELPKNAVKGDVYNVESGHELHPAGTNWAWDGEKWDALGGLVDLSVVEGKISANETAIAKNAEDILAETNRATGIEGGLRTDLGNKNDKANAEGSAFARIASLSDSVSALTSGSTGSIADQIATAVSNLKGDATTNADTLGELEDLIEAEAATARANEGANATAISNEESRAKGEEARIEGLVTAEKTRAEGVESGLDSRLLTAESTIAKLDGADTVEGSVKKQIKDAVAAEAERATGVESGLASRIQAIEESVGEGGSVAEDIQANADAIAAIQADYLKKADKDELSKAIEDAEDAANNYTDAEIAKAKTYAEGEADAAETAAKAYADGLAKNYDAAGSAAAVQGNLDTEVARAKAEEKKNADAIAALTKTVNDNETDIEGKMTAMGNRMTTAEGTIVTQGESILTNSNAISALQNNTVNGKKISTNPVLAGGDIALTGYTTVEGGFVSATDTISSAIAKLENDLIWHEA